MEATPKGVTTFRRYKKKKKIEALSFKDLGGIKRLINKRVDKPCKGDLKMVRCEPD